MTDIPMIGQIGVIFFKKLSRFNRGCRFVPFPVPFSFMPPVEWQIVWKEDKHASLRIMLRIVGHAKIWVGISRFIIGRRHPLELLILLNVIQSDPVVLPRSWVLVPIEETVNPVLLLFIGSKFLLRGWSWYLNMTPLQWIVPLVKFRTVAFRLRTRPNPRRRCCRWILPVSNLPHSLDPQTLCNKSRKRDRHPIRRDIPPLRPI